jgi:uncharacterized membrane protein
MLRRAVDQLLSRAEQDAVVESIGQAESRTSGEIKVHIETRCRGGNPLARARWLLGELGLHKARHRNGVLVYIAVRDRRFAVLGDVGAHDRASQALWDEVARRLAERFREGAFRAGLVEAVGRIGEVLAEHFPPDPGGDAHPVSNEISGR